VAVLDLPVLPHEGGLGAALAGLLLLVGQGEQGGGLGGHGGGSGVAPKVRAPRASPLSRPAGGDPPPGAGSVNPFGLNMRGANRPPSRRSHPVVSMRTPPFAFLAVLLAGLLGPALKAQPVITLTAEEAVERGLEHNTRLAASRADAEGARAAYRQARGARLPALSASGRATHLRNVPRADLQVPGLDTSFAFFAIPRTQFYSEVSVEQPLFSGGRLHHRARAAASQARAAALLARQEEADVALEIRAAFAGLQQALAVRAAVEAALAAVQTHVRRTEALLAEGAALRIDLLAAQTRRSEVQLERLDAENAVRVSRLELNRLIGLPLGVEVEATGDPISPDPRWSSTPSLPRPPEPAPSWRRWPSRSARSRRRSPPTGRVAARGRRRRALRLRPAQPDQPPRPGRIPRPLGARAYGPLAPLRRGPTGGHRRRAGPTGGGPRAAGGGRGGRGRGGHAPVPRGPASDGSAGGRGAARRRGGGVVPGRPGQFAEGAVLPAQVLDAEQVLRAAQARQAQAAADRAVAYAAVLNALGQVW
jgi:hypothetical protein